MQQFITILKKLSNSKDRNTKGHAIYFLKNLQRITEEIAEQDNRNEQLNNGDNNTQ